jgi:hypothetical protein
MRYELRRPVPLCLGNPLWLFKMEVVGVRGKWFFFVGDRLVKPIGYLALDSAHSSHWQNQWKSHSWQERPWKSEIECSITASQRKEAC